MAQAGYLSLNPLSTRNPVLSIVLPLVFLFIGGFGLPGGAVYLNENAIRSNGWRSRPRRPGPLANLRSRCWSAGLSCFTFRTPASATAASGRHWPFLLFIQIIGDRPQPAARSRLSMVSASSPRGCRLRCGSLPSGSGMFPHAPSMVLSLAGRTSQRGVLWSGLQPREPCRFRIFFIGLGQQQFHSLGSKNDRPAGGTHGARGARHRGLPATGRRTGSHPLGDGRGARHPGPGRSAAGGRRPGGGVLRGGSRAAEAGSRAFPVWK